MSTISFTKTQDEHQNLCHTPEKKFKHQSHDLLYPWIPNTFFIKPPIAGHFFKKTSHAKPVPQEKQCRFYFMTMKAAIFLLAMILYAGFFGSSYLYANSVQSEERLILFDFSEESIASSEAAPGIRGSDWKVSSGSPAFGYTNAGDWEGSGVPFIQGGGGWGQPNPEEGKYFFFTINTDGSDSFGLNRVAFRYRATGAGPAAFTLSINDETIKTVDIPSNETLFIEETIAFESLDSAVVKIIGWDNESRATSGGGLFQIDDFALYGNVDFGNIPFLSVEPAELTGLSYREGEGGSDPQMITVSGVNLDPSELTLSATPNFQVASQSDGVFSNTLSHPSYSGEELDFWVRLKPGLAPENYTGSLSLITGQTERDVSLSGVVVEPLFLNYSFTGNDPSPAQEPAEAVTSEFQISSGTLNFGTTGTWPGSGVPYAEGNSGWGAEDPADARYFFFEITSEHGYGILLHQISFDYYATAAGPSAVTVEINGNTVASYDVPSGEYLVFQEDLHHLNPSGKVIVAIKGWNNGSRPTSGGGSFRINDVRLDGEMASPYYFANLTGSPGYRMLSLPVSGASYDDLLAPIWTQGLAPHISQQGNTSSGTPNVYSWNLDSQNNHPDNWDEVTDLTAVPSPGSGFLAYIFENDDPENQEATQGFPKELFLHGGQHSAPSGDIDAALNQNPSGWTLLGNPFTQPIQFSMLYEQDQTQNLTDAIYIWDVNNEDENSVPGESGAGSWKSFTVSTGAGELEDGIIAPFQGFFVQNTAEGESRFSFSENAVTTGDFFLGKERKSDKLSLQLGGEGMSNTAWLAFSGSGSVSFTLGDAHQLEPLSGHYCLIAFSKGEKLLDIGHFPFSAEKFDIPVVVDATIAGDYSIKLNHYSVDEEMPLYLEDREKNIAVKIDEGMVYPFEWNVAEKRKKTVKKANTIKKTAIKPVKRELSQQSSHRFVLTNHTTLTLSAAYENLPQGFELKQNYPNPFNPETTIRYHIPVKAPVTLRVYDMLGREIVTLVNKTKQPGVHTAAFDASSLASGIYIYRLEAGEERLTRRMTLVK